MDGVATQGPAVTTPRKPREVRKQFLTLMEKLRQWRSDDHEDAMVLHRNLIIEIIEGVDAICDEERVAKAIYGQLPYTEKSPLIKPPWFPGGNSLKQDEARRYAHTALFFGEQR